MARKLRLQYPGAMYHVINRGNYRGNIFETNGAKLAFEGCLGHACEMTGWRLHAYTIMRNHYHLSVETPHANLVDGMQWLQSTFANRFNRFRGERGHVFQGRYQAILVEDGSRMGAVAHYLHLNPVRARLVTIQRATHYRWSSLHFLTQPKQRPAWLSLDSALTAAGDLPDNPAGHAAYLDYLGWVAEDETVQKALAFDKMCRGWVIGSEAFKAKLIAEHKDALAQVDLREADLAEVKESLWEKALQSCLKRLDRSSTSARNDPKSAAWKVAIAAHLRSVSTVKNPWLAERLEMGDPDGVSRYVSEARQGKRPLAVKLQKKIADIRV